MPSLPAPALSLALAVAAVACVVLAGLPRRRAAAERDALARVGELIRDRRVLRLELDLLRARHGRDPNGWAAAVLRRLHSRRPADWIELFGCDGRTVCRLGPVSDDEPRLVVESAAGTLASSQATVDQLDVRAVESIRQRLLPEILEEATASNERDLSATKLALYAEMEGTGDLVTALARYLERLAADLGCDRATVYLRQPAGAFRAIASGGSEVPAVASEGELVASFLDGEIPALPTTSECGPRHVVTLAPGDRPAAALVIGCPSAAAEPQAELLAWVRTHLAGVLKDSAGRLALTRDARADRLTGLANRAEFDLRLAEAASGEQDLVAGTVPGGVDPVVRR